MAKYDVTYACGHTGKIALFGKQSDRDWRLGVEESKLCPECWQAKREVDKLKENAESAAANQDAGLPPLEGTEKQVVWAETIRFKIINAIQTKLVDRVLEAAKTEHPEEWAEAIATFKALQKHSAASWWIDHRDTELDTYSLRKLLIDVAAEVEKLAAEPPAAVVEAANAEATVYPEKPVSNLVAEVSVKDNVLTASYPERNEEFRLLMHKFKLKWDGGWSRKIGKFDGTIQDRTAELANHILLAGFPVRIYDAEIRRRAVAGEFSPEPERWIFAGKDNYAGWLTIYWPKGDDFYRAAKRIPGSRWRERRMMIPYESYQELLDFANMYKFNISDGAQETIAAAKAAREAALTTGVKQIKKESLPEPGDKPGLLEVPEDVTIDDEFRDDD
jgi:hypothetical protein